MLKFEKAEFLRRRLECLGYLVGMGKVQPTEKRIAALLAMDSTPSGLSVRFRVRVVDELARVDGQVHATTERLCDRCGARVRLVLEGATDLTFARLPPPGVDAVELDAGDLDLSWFDGERVDLGQALSEQLGLWMPLRVVCGEIGTTRLDEGTCALPEQEAGPEIKRENPFAVLKKPR